MVPWKTRWRGSAGWLGGCRTAPVVGALLGGILLFMGSLASSPAAAQPRSREAELETLRDEIAALRDQLGRLDTRRADLAGELDRTEIEVRLQEKRVEEARAARFLAAAQLEAVERRVAELQARVEELHGALERRLVDLYRLGRQGYLRPLFSIRQRHDLLPGIRQLRFLARRDSTALDSFLAARAQLAFERSEAVARRHEVEEWLDHESERFAELRRLRGRKATLLARLTRESDTLTVRAARLTDKARKLSSFLDFLYGRTSAQLSGTPMQGFQGVLDWPVQGHIVRGFGPRKDPRYQTEVPHNGLEFSVDEGAEVRAVFPGRVLFAAPFQGFGRTAIVHHPGRVFSLYAGLEELRVGEGDMLSLGEVVGLAAATLYFEIRVENRPVDPRDWLR